MKPNRILAVVFSVSAAACCFGPVANAAPTADHERLVSANVDFSFKLLKRLAKEQPGTNIFVSPFSASTVLQMVCNGAGGQTKAEMLQALGTTGLQPDSLNEAHRTLEQSLATQNTNVTLLTANAIWYRKSIPVKPEFISGSQQSFAATVAALDFDDPRSVDIVNAWASEKTRGRITGIANGAFNPLTQLFLANAVYFKGKWDLPFDKKATKDRLFHLRGSGQKKGPMMEQSRKFSYRRGSGYQAVRLEYQGWSLGMYVFLPDPDSSPEKLLAVLNGDKWQHITEPGFSERDGTVVLPKFKLEYGVELKQSLKALGMKTAFDNGNFSGISGQPLFISAVRQRTFVEVNEEGTEAVSLTDVPIEMSGPEPNPSPPFMMIVDRPFLILIEDKVTKTILFVGVIFDPSPA